MKVLYGNASDAELFTNNALLLGAKELNSKNTHRNVDEMISPQVEFCMFLLFMQLSPQDIVGYIYVVYFISDYDDWSKM